jgi:hypothetical protein
MIFCWALDMLDFDELKKQQVLDEHDLLVRLAIDAVYDIKAADEYLRADKNEASRWTPKRSIGDWTSFWYSHLCGGGCYNYAFSLYVEPKGFDGPAIKLMPSKDNGEARVFLASEPKTLSLKAYARKILDVVKKSQNRTKWWSDDDRAHVR